MTWATFLSAREAYAPRAMIFHSGPGSSASSARRFRLGLTHLLAFALKIEVPFESRLAVGLSLPAALLLAAGRLSVVRPLARRVYGGWPGPVLVLGDTERAERLAADYEEHRRPAARRSPAPVVDHPRGGAERVEAMGVSEVVIEPDGRPLEEVFDTAFACLDARPRSSSSRTSSRW